MKFQVGDRVRVYGYGPDMSMQPIVGSVHRDVMGDFIKVQIDRKSWSQENVDYLWAHPKQCRRLKPKKPKPVKREARRVYLSQSSYNNVMAYHDEGLNVCVWKKPVDHLNTIEFVELAKGEIPITKEKLAAIWQVIGSYTSQGHSQGFSEFCKALGLGEG